MQKNDSRRTSSSRWRSSVGRSPEASGVAFMTVEGGAKVTGDSAIVVTPYCVSCGAKVSKGTRRSVCYSVPNMSPVRGLDGP